MFFCGNNKWAGEIHKLQCENQLLPSPRQPTLQAVAVPQQWVPIQYPTAVVMLHHMMSSQHYAATASSAYSSSEQLSSSSQNGRLEKILFGLRADGEEGRQVEALTQLCEMLSIGTEDSLSTFSVDSLVPVLVGLLNHESNPDIMLLVARALTHLCDVLPSSCAAVVHYGAVSIF